MKWAKSKGFSKTKTDISGRVLSNNKESTQNKSTAMEILDNWRAIHSYPMHIFKKRLKRVSEKLDKNALSVQRLKRVPSILKKLRRNIMEKNQL
jgi:putative GTP pyrophosphokinase